MNSGQLVQHYDLSEGGKTPALSGYVGLSDDWHSETGAFFLGSRAVGPDVVNHGLHHPA